MFKYNGYELGYKLLILYIYIVFFGSFILKLIGLSPSIGLPLISLLDVLPLVIWVISNPNFRIKTHDYFVDTFRFWLLWCLVLLLLIFTTFVHNGSFLPAFIHWGALIRYIPLAIVVLTLNKVMDINDRLFYHLKIITYILIVIGYLCIVLGSEATIFLPLLPENATGERETLVGNYSAVFANTVDYGFILLILYLIAVYNNRNTELIAYVISLIFLFPIFKTGSAGATLVFFIIAFFRHTQSNKVLRYSVMSIVFCGIITVIYIYWDIVVLIYDNTKLSRMGMLTQTMPDFIKELNFDSFFGVGVDPIVVYSKVNSFPDKVLMLRYTSASNINSVIGDVYWVAVLVYQGLVGICLLLFIYGKLLFATINKTYIDDDYDYNQIIRWLFFMIVFLSLLNQILVVKTFAIIFWILIGVVYVKIIKLCN